MLPNLPSLRSSLLRLHGDILAIDDEKLFVCSDHVLSDLEKIVVLLEDRRFFQHKGYDVRSVAQECIRALTFKRHGGASTTDAQLFRTISKRYERTFRRKIRELIGARALQYKFGKVEILRIYLQVAYFGTGLSGVEAASMAVYNKFSADLTV